jgi:flagellar basal-body rod modification protein FlgD
MSDMAIPAVNSNATTQAPASRIPIKTLGQEDFIKILVTQMTSQDPMNPQKDTEFVAQMAQFSQLESSKTVTSELTSMREQQDFLKANSLIGRRVQMASDDGMYIGTVSGVEMKGKEPLLQVGEETFALADLIRVDQPQSGTYAK